MIEKPPFLTPHGLQVEDSLLQAALHQRLRAKDCAVQLLMPAAVASAPQLPPYSPVPQARRRRPCIALQSPRCRLDCNVLPVPQVHMNPPPAFQCLPVQLDGGPLVELLLEDGTSLPTRLLVGADGGGSRVREWAQASAGLAPGCMHGFQAEAPVG